MKILLPAFLSAVSVAGAVSKVLPDCKPWQSQGLNQVKMIDGKGTVTLSDHGRTNLQIVIPAKEKSYYYKNTAKMLQKYLEEATGAKFNIVRGSLKSGKGIFIGPCDDPVVKKAFEQAQQLPEETLVVKVFEHGIMLLGNDQPNHAGHQPGRLYYSSPYWSKGTFFAMVDFLQRMVGCRFYFPGELGTVIPDYKAQKVTIPVVEYTDKPAFQFRLSSYHNHGFTDNKSAGTGDSRVRNEWSAMMRLGGIGNQRTSHTDNDWNKLFAKTHPEYFALREDGSRMIGIRPGLSVQRCYSSEGGFQAHLNEIDKYYKSNGKDYTAFASPALTPDAKYIRWWPNDGFRGCHCADCMKLTDPKAPLNRRHSRLIWAYVTKLAKACKERWPDKKLLVPAYSSFRVIPDDIKVPDNVEIIPVLPGSGFSMAFLKEPVCRKLAADDVKRLKKLNSGKVWMWMHYPHRPRISNRIHVPYPVPHYMQEYIKNNQDVFSGFYLNGHPTTVLALDGVVLYLWFQLLWNPAIKVDAVTDEYCNLMFGPAAGTMKQYWKLVTDRWENTRWKKLPDFANAQDRISGLIPQSCYFGETYPGKVRDKLELMLEKAAKETPADSIYRKRMNWMIAGTKKFFVQGRFYDAGNSVKTTVTQLTPVIDANLAEWRKVPVVELLDNASGARVKEKTFIRMAADKDNLYFAGDVKSKNGKFNTSGKKEPRDFPLWRRDNIEIFICADTPGLKEAGFPQNSQFHHFIINADGSIYDAYKDSNGKSDAKVNFKIDLQTKRHKDGFTFELKVPYKSIGTNLPEPGAMWPVNVYRTTYSGKNTQYQAWSPTMGSFHDSSRFGMLEFPRNTLWTMKLNGSPFIHPKDPAGVQETITFKNNQMIVKCKAGPEVKKNFELKFYGKAGFRPDIKDSKKPLIFRMEILMQGRGIFRVRGGTGPARKNDQYVGIMYWPRVPKGQSIDETVVLQQDKTLRGKGKQIHSSNTCVFAVQAIPGADFTVILKKMEIFTN